MSFDCKKCCNSSKRYSKASSSVTLITLSFPSYVGLLYYANKPTLHHDGNHYLFTAELAVKNKFTRDGNSSQTQEELTAVSFFSSSPSNVSTEKNASDILPMTSDIWPHPTSPLPVSKSTFSPDLQTFSDWASLRLCLWSEGDSHHYFVAPFVHSLTCALLIYNFFFFCLFFISSWWIWEFWLSICSYFFVWKK